MKFLYKIGQLVEVSSSKLGKFYGKIIQSTPDGKYKNYLIVVVHPSDKLKTGNQAWIDEDFIIGIATEDDIIANSVLTK